MPRLGYCTLCFVVTVVFTSQRLAAQTSKVPVGLNLSGVTYYSRELPFVDLMKGAGWNQGLPFNYDGNIVVRDDGYPAQINSGSAYRLFDKPIGVPGGSYVLLYDGSGSVSITDGFNASNGRIQLNLADASSKKRYTIRISSTVPSNPVRNMRLVPASLESIYASGEPANPFRQEFLDNWSIMDGFRYMDWHDTNGNPMSQWSDRTLPTDSTQAGEKGVALEYQIAHANQTQSNPWFNIPHLADDAFVENMAQMIYQQVDPGLNVRIELSNEVWNGQFDQAQYAIQQGLIAEPNQEPWIAGQHWYAKRSSEVFQIFEDVFTAGGTNPQGMDRLTRIIGSQAGNSSMIDRIMEYGDIADHVDAVAIAPYVQGVIRTSSTSPDAQQIKNWSSEQRWNWYWGQFDEAVERMERYAVKANGYGIDLFAYEGGQHLVAQGQLNQDQELVNIFIEMNRDPQMRDLYRQLLQEWERVGGKDFMLFASTSAFGGFGSWGLKEYEDQPLSMTPKLQGVLDYLSGAEPEPPPTPEGVIFSDTFELSPGAVGETGRAGSAVGWVESSSSHWTATVVGGHAVAQSSANEIASLTRTIDTTGMEQIAIQLVAFQEGSESYETLEDLASLAPDWSDFLQVLVDLDDGAGWQRVLIDHGAWTGENQPAAGSWGSESGTGSPTATAILALPAAAADNPQVQLQIQVYGSKTSEVWNLDQVTVFGALIGGLAGDYNGDGLVNQADYTLWRDTLGKSVPQGTGADGDSNGIVDAGDYAVWKQNFGQHSTNSLQAANVPEPLAQNLLIFAVILGALHAVWQDLRTPDAIGN